MDGKTIQVKLWRLSRNDSPMTGEATRVVVAAATEKQAREAANQETTEGYIFTDGALTTCEELGLANDGITGVQVIERA